MFEVCLMWDREGGRMSEEVIQGLTNAVDFPYSLSARTHLQVEIPW
jgi:hypothetical protein